MTNAIGTLINDPVLLQVADDEIWLSIADSDAELWAEAVAIGKGLDVQVYEPDVSPLAIQGPKAIDVVGDLFGDHVRDIKYFGFIDTELNGIPIVLCRSGLEQAGRVFELFLRDGGAAMRSGISLLKPAPHTASAPVPRIISNALKAVLFRSTLIPMITPIRLKWDWASLLISIRILISSVRMRSKRSRPKASGAVSAGLCLMELPLKATNTHKWPVTLKGEYVGFASASAWTPRQMSYITALITVEAADHGTDLVIDGERYPQRLCHQPALPQGEHPVKATDMSDYKFDTLSLHAGQTPDERHGSRAVPIHQTTSYMFESHRTGSGALQHGSRRPCLFPPYQSHGCRA